MMSSAARLERALVRVTGGDLDSAEVDLKATRGHSFEGLRGLIVRLRGQREKVSAFVRQVFSLGTQVSAFDLRLRAASEEMSRTSGELASRTASINTSMGETSGAINEIASSNNDLAAALNNISAESRTLSENTRKSQSGLEAAIVDNARLQDVSRSMQADFDDLARVLDGVGSVVDGIVDISDQTNMLALNASIEAARAGDAGRGFSVVADQIRRLSETTRNQVQTITKSLDQLRAAAAKSSASARETVESAQGINKVLESVTTAFCRECKRDRPDRRRPRDHLRAQRGAERRSGGNDGHRDDDLPRDEGPGRAGALHERGERRHPGHRRLDAEDRG